MVEDQTWLSAFTLSGGQRSEVRRSGGTAVAFKTLVQHCGGRVTSRPGLSSTCVPETLTAGGTSPGVHRRRSHRNQLWNRGSASIRASPRGRGGAVGGASSSPEEDGPCGGTGGVWGGQPMRCNQETELVPGVIHVQGRRQARVAPAASTNAMKIKSKCLFVYLC